MKKVKLALVALVTILTVGGAVANARFTTYHYIISGGQYVLVNPFIGTNCQPTVSDVFCSYLFNTSGTPPTTLPLSSNLPNDGNEFHVYQP